ncbi:MAG: copper chaperone PCu(A)C [Gammaproteobacteria bacterium]|nr:copper chaperone PCu(A)C [Gammaproteobacteria bacterium]
MKPYRLIVLFFTSFLLSQTAIAESTLTFENVWIAEAPPSSSVMVAYMTINNASDQITKIISATSSSFKSISFHQTKHEDDMAKMEHMSTLTIPAKGNLVLKAGSHHIMLFNPVKKLKAGDQVVLDLKLENGDIINLNVPVKKQQMDHSSHMHH